jgi:type IV fimbrial biogenesis protein FimT
VEFVQTREPQDEFIKAFSIEEKATGHVRGFTLIEVVVAMVILTVLAAVAIPGYSVWLPNYRLKAAARDVVSNFQLAKMGAIKENKAWAVVFDPDVTPGKYFICADDNGDGWDGPPAMGGNDVLEKAVDLDAYGVGVGFGHGNATHPIGGSFGANDITYTTPDEVAVFGPKGTVKNLGYVYFSNARGASWAVGTPATSGVIVLRKWTGSAWE